ncbi:STAS domain-containing protein [Streptacidiphilus jiangxiensis]|uniref:Anti-anti-sigma factor n=1 Tax=Streptacidiphilus jiangxiensis TaxID=235985 RepID=A0A1H7HF00_STRJI|nr:STAS domain-containing protein [Streptacidiphilus jiangxiensis]SEK48871.1 anti-anti-sigma factor [Streptacidiphilus jiangxiensis]
MPDHRPLRPCDSAEPHRLAFSVRRCRRSLRRPACCPVLHLRGELDVAATPTLLVAVARTLTPGRARPGLVLDVGALTFCDAAGLTGLLRTRRLADAAGTPVYLAAPPGTISRLLALCDLERCFPLHPS